jgi:hypothetical protein
LLKDIKRIKEEEDRLLTSAEIKFSSNVWDVNPKNTISKPDVAIISRKLWYIRIIYLITNPIVYIFTGKWNY